MERKFIRQAGKKMKLNDDEKSLLTELFESGIIREYFASISPVFIKEDNKDYNKRMEELGQKLGLIIDADQIIMNINRDIKTIQQDRMKKPIVRGLDPFGIDE